jgi:DNA modification methylase
VWLHSWALFVQRPSDLGYSDEGYALPPITVTYHELPTPVPVGKFDRDGQAKMIADAALSLKDAAEEKRESIDARVAKMMEIVRANPDDHFILWHDLEAERHAIKTALPAAVSVYGSQDLEEREQDIIDFSEGRTQYLSTKPEIAGSGCNFQRHCHKAIFLGITYKFNDLIQAIHRIHRFLQAHPVEIHIIYTEAERQVLAALQEKWAEDDVLRNRMSDIIRAHGLTSTGLEQRLARTIGCVRRVERSDRFEVVNNDSVDEYRGIESNRFGLIVTSIPFGNHYEYSESYNDFGHNPDNEAFFRQMDYLTPELLRTLKPGRVLAVHVKDRIRFGNVTGYGMPSVEPFHADCIAHYRRHGFIYFGMITIVTDVVRENNQTYRLGWTEQCKDGTKMGVGSPEYVLLFRKLPTDTSKGYADERVAKSKEKYSRARWQTDAHAFWRSAGDRLMTVDELATFGPDTIGRMFERFTSENVYDYEQHVRIGEALDDRGALPSTFMCLAPASHHPDVWHDVVRMRTLNGEQSSRGLANHICPLQFDVVDRLIVRYSNEDEEVSDPFGGLFTVPVRALKLKRRGHAVELNATYFFDGLRYVRTAAEEIAMPTLFNLAATEEKASA